MSSDFALLVGSFKDAAEVPPERALGSLRILGLAHGSVSQGWCAGARIVQKSQAHYHQKPLTVGRFLKLGPAKICVTTFWLRPRSPGHFCLVGARGRPCLCLNCAKISVLFFLPQ